MYVGALSPDGLVRVTPLENIKNLGGCSFTRWVDKSDSPLRNFVDSLLPDGLVRVTPLENFVDSLLPDGLVTMTPHM